MCSESDAGPQIRFIHPYADGASVWRAVYGTLKYCTSPVSRDQAARRAMSVCDSVGHRVTFTRGIIIIMIQIIKHAYNTQSRSGALHDKYTEKSITPNQK